MVDAFAHGMGKKTRESWQKNPLLKNVARKNILEEKKSMAKEKQRNEHWASQAREDSKRFKSKVQESSKELDKVEEELREITAIVESRNLRRKRERQERRERASSVASALPNVSNNSVTVAGQGVGIGGALQVVGDLFSYHRTTNNHVVRTSPSSAKRNADLEALERQILEEELAERRVAREAAEMRRENERLKNEALKKEAAVLQRSSSGQSSSSVPTVVTVSSDDHSSVTTCPYDENSKKV